MIVKWMKTGGKTIVNQAFGNGMGMVDMPAIKIDKNWGMVYGIVLPTISWEYIEDMNGIESQK